MKGYKDEVVPFEDRLLIIKTIAKGIGNIKVVVQNSLDPSDVIKIYKPDSIASGDGWEEVELKAIKEYKLYKVNIKIPKRYSSSKIIDKIKKIKIYY